MLNISCNLKLSNKISVSNSVSKLRAMILFIFVLASILTINCVSNINEITNLEVVNTLCEVLAELVPDSKFRPHKNLIKHVTDRPGHDRRYAIDASKIQNQLGWKPQESFETGLRKTVQWYLENNDNRNTQL